MACDEILGTAGSCCTNTNGEFYNGLVSSGIREDIDIVHVGLQGCPIFTTITAGARETINGSYSLTPFGKREAFWDGGVEYKFKEIDDFPSTVTVAAAATAADTTLTLVTSKYIVAGQVLITESNEQIRVISKDVDGVTVLVERATGTVAAEDIAVDEKLYILSVAAACGCTGEDSISPAITDQNNFFQKIVTTFKSTDCQNFLNNQIKKLSVEKWNGLDINFLKMQYLDHMRKIEKTLLYGQKNYDATQGIGYTEGLHQLALRGGNVADISAAPTLAAFSQAITPMFRKGAGCLNRYVFLGEEAATVMDGLVQAQSLTNPCCFKTPDGFDFSYSELKLAGGRTVMFKYHPFMEVGSPLSKYALILDMPSLGVIYSSGVEPTGAPVKGTTQVNLVTSKSDYACQQWDIVTWICLQNKNAQAHGLIKLAV